MNYPYEDLDREIDLGRHGREEAREWAMSVVDAALGAAALAAIALLVGAF
jgi:hypothetical protein